MEHFFRKETFCIEHLISSKIHVIIKYLPITFLNSCTLLDLYIPLALEHRATTALKNTCAQSNFIDRYWSRFPALVTGSCLTKTTKWFFKSNYQILHVILCFLNVLVTSDRWEYRNSTCDSDKRVTDFTPNYNVKIKIIRN